MKCPECKTDLLRETDYCPVCGYYIPNYLKEQNAKRICEITNRFFNKYKIDYEELLKFDVDNWDIDKIKFYLELCKYLNHETSDFYSVIDNNDLENVIINTYSSIDSNPLLNSYDYFGKIKNVLNSITSKENEVQQLYKERTLEMVSKLGIKDYAKKKELLEPFSSNVEIQVTLLSDAIEIENNFSKISEIDSLILDLNNKNLTDVAFMDKELELSRLYNDLKRTLSFENKELLEKEYETKIDLLEEKYYAIEDKENEQIRQQDLEYENKRKKEEQKRNEIRRKRKKIITISSICFAVVLVSIIFIIAVSAKSCSESNNASKYEERASIIAPSLIGNTYVGKYGYTKKYKFTSSTDGVFIYDVDGEKSISFTYVIESDKEGCWASISIKNNGTITAYFFTEGNSIIALKIDGNVYNKI